mgnify:FL=1
MKRILRHYVIDTFTLWVVSLVADGLSFQDGFRPLALAGVGITIVSIIAKPVINVLLLPLNLITYGLFRWVSSAIVIYLVTLVVPGFKVLGFEFSGLKSAWVDIPSLNFEGFLAYVAFSFILSIISSFIYWLIK